MKISMFALLGAALLAAMPLPSTAQPEENGPQPAMMPGGPGMPGPDDGLSQEQREKVQAAMKAEREAMKPLHRDLRDSITKLSDLLEDGAGEKELQTQMDRVEKVRKAIQTQREKSEAKISAMLPVKQRAMMMVRMAHQMEAMHGGMQQGMRPGMGGMRPGMRPGTGGPGMMGPGMRRGIPGGPNMGPGGPGEEEGNQPPSGPDREGGPQGDEP